ncbi:MAG: Flp pilus assembly complex ATPase component TadA [Clostridiales bacterium]|nr:Flp pilus assembly complex ATPase component TadA [Clostridiales bacterium]MDR2752305.1 Flp pilus assembly complex ATPase component TadA [Clostridiales bacterium]
MKGRTLGELLLNTGLLSEEKLRAANSRRVLTGASLLEVAISEKMIDFAQAQDLLARHFEISSVDLSKVEFDKDAVDLLDYEFASRYKVLPIKLAGFRLVAAMGDPLNQRVQDDVFVRTGCRVEPALARVEEIEYFAGQLYGPAQMKSLSHAYPSDEKFKVELLAAGPEIHTVTATDLIDAAIAAAVTARASALHIEPFEKEIRVRIRVDGSMRPLAPMEVSLRQNIIARLKLMGRMDSSERDKPQQGRFTRAAGGTQADFRVSIAPTLYGEKAVIKITRGDSAISSKEGLGFLPQDLSALNSLFDSQGGLVLLSGPAGSGKTSTLETYLLEMDKNIAIVRVEESYDRILPGITHMEAGGANRISQAEAIRAALSQDSDAIAAEVRDLESAEAMLHAALKGRLAIALLDSPSAVKSLSFLLDLGLNPKLLSMALKGAASQRLLRTACPHCKVDSRLEERESHLLGLAAGATVSQTPGCQACYGTGHFGRFAVCECFLATDDLRDLVSRKAEPREIGESLSASGFVSIREKAVDAVLQGSVTPKEAIENALY